MSRGSRVRRRPRAPSAVLCGLLAGGLLVPSGWSGEPAGEEAAPRTRVRLSSIEVVAGGGDRGDGGPAAEALFTGIGGLAVDPAGNVFLSDSGDNRVRRIDARTGIITTVAGTGLLVDAGPSQPATAQAVRGPAALAIDPEGRYLWVGEALSRSVRKIDLARGTLEDLGAPPGGFGHPSGIAWTPSGIVVADSLQGQLWKLGAGGSWTGLLPEGTRPDGTIRTVAGDRRGRLYMAEYFAHRVLRWDPATGQMDTAAGPGDSPLRKPDGIAFDGEGNLVIADSGNRRICRLDLASGRLQTLAEAGPAGTEDRWAPGPIAVDARGNIWVGDLQRNRLLRFARGTSAPVVVAGGGDIRDGGPALAARLAHPGGVLADAAGNIYISDTLHHRVRVIDAATGRIRTLAGTGASRYNGDGIPAASANLGYPARLQMDAGGRIYVGDYSNHRVRRIDLESGLISTVAGNGSAGEDGDGGMAAAAPLVNPYALLLEDRSLIIVSGMSPALRQMDLVTGRIFTVRMRRIEEIPVFFGVARWREQLVLASPRPGSIDILQDDKLVRLIGAPDIDSPQDVAVSPKGELYICETGRNRVVKWNGEKLEVIVENLGQPSAIAFDPIGNLLIADTLHNRVLRVRLGLQPGMQLADRALQLRRSGS